MNPFQNLLQYYQNGFRQQTDSTCGPASVILAACSLGLPRYSERLWHDMRFTKWLPVADFPIRGIALHELCFLSEILYSCQLEIRYQRALRENIHLFQQDITQCFQNNQLMIANFIQDDFIEHNTPSAEGNPHYSPIADLNNNHQLLIADVDPEVKEPYWVTVEALFESMAKPNLAFNLPRGWITLRLRTSSV